MCYVCNLSLENSKSLVFHLKHDHNLGEYDVYKCAHPGCFRIFSCLNSFGRHIRTIHERNTTVTDEICNENAVCNLVNNSADIQHKNEPLNYDLNIPIIKETHNKKVTSFISKLYYNSLIPRKVVQRVIQESMKVFFTGKITDLKKCV